MNIYLAKILKEMNYYLNVSGKGHSTKVKLNILLAGKIKRSFINFWSKIIPNSNDKKAFKNWETLNKKYEEKVKKKK